MIRLLKCEYLKTRRRYIFLTALVVTAAQLVWILSGKYNADQLRLGWMLFLYQIPLANAIFFPLLAIIVSSRLCDIEHKGVMMKHLLTVSERGKYYDAKLLYGMIIMFFCTLLSWGVTLLFGRYKQFEGEAPMQLYLLHLLFTMLPTAAVYIFQHILSLYFRNQAISFFAGVIGGFAGAFSMFLPQLPWLRRSLIWGYYGALQFVGLFGWTTGTKYEYAYFEVMEIDWAAFGMLAVMCAVLYVTGRILFCRKEL